MGDIEIDGVKIRKPIASVMLGSAIGIPPERKNNQLNRELCYCLYVLYHILGDLKVKNMRPEVVDLYAKYYDRYQNDLQFYLDEYKKNKGISHPHEQELIAHFESFKNIKTGNDMNRVQAKTADIQYFVHESPYND